jgi:hypothetical protein
MASYTVGDRGAAKEGTGPSRRAGTPRSSSERGILSCRLGSDGRAARPTVSAQVPGRKGLTVRTVPYVRPCSKSSETSSARPS